MTARIAQRTSGPWHISKARAIEVCAAGGRPIAELWINEDTEVNAAFIVEACNAYDAALEREARLRAQNAVLRAALEHLSRLRKYGDGMDDCPPDGDDAMRVLNWHIDNARLALSKTQD